VPGGGPAQAPAAAPTTQAQAASNGGGAGAPTAGPPPPLAMEAAMEGRGPRDMVRLSDVLHRLIGSSHQKLLALTKRYQRMLFSQACVALG
jgi:hypothetical protein